MMEKRNVADMLAEEADHAEQHRDDELAPRYRRAPAPRELAQVYSLRIPVERLEQLRRLAADKHVTPSALMRAWVLDRLDTEAAGEAAGDEAHAGREHAEGSGESLVQAIREVVREEFKRAGVWEGQLTHQPPLRQMARNGGGRLAAARVGASSERVEVGIDESA